MPVQALMLFGTAAALGFRHGFDWDHLAAITDIVGASETSQMPHQTAANKRQGLLLAFMYALGHGAMVAILGFAAINLFFILPAWVDGLMERIVGATLLILAVWLCSSLVDHCQGKADFRLQSRWLALFSLLHKMHDRKAAPKQRRYGIATTFGIGMLHGIGAETGTQVLLITALGGVASHEIALAMLVSFIAGLLVSNLTVAVCSMTTFDRTQKARPIYLTAGVLTCAFSFIVGSYFLLGQAQSLPDLQLLLGKI